MRPPVSPGQRGWGLLSGALCLPHPPGSQSNSLPACSRHLYRLKTHGLSWYKFGAQPTVAGLGCVPSQADVHCVRTHYVRLFFSVHTCGCSCLWGSQ